MAKFLIEVPHSDHLVECARVVKIFLTWGSHFVRNADWGCHDGVHKAWLIADLESKEEALQILPPIFRPQAKIVEMNKFTLEEMNEIIQQSEG